MTADMNREIELHDSVISAVEQVGDRVIVYFKPAYIHKSVGRPGIDTGTGWAQDVQVTIANGFVTGVIPPLPSGLVAGYLILSNVRHENGIPVPSDAKVETQLSMKFGCGSKVQVNGVGCTVIPVGPESYVEEFPGY